jgi:hypothetical protein
LAVLFILVVSSLAVLVILAVSFAMFIPPHRIAAQDELEDIKISFDEGETELNFAEGERPLIYRRYIAPVLLLPPCTHTPRVSLTANRRRACGGCRSCNAHPGLHLRLQP